MKAPVDEKKTNPRSHAMAFRWTLGSKLILLIAVLLLSSVGVVVFLSTRLFVQDNTALIQQMNADTAMSLAAQAKNFFESVTDQMRILGTILLQNDKTNPNDPVITEFFKHQENFLALFVYQHDPNGLPAFKSAAVAPQLTELGDSLGEHARKLLEQSREFNLTEVAHGRTQITSLSLPAESAVVGLAIPFVKVSAQENNFSHSLVALFRPTKLMQIFSKGDIFTGFLVDGRGRLLAHSDSTRMGTNENLLRLEIVRQMLEGRFSNGQTRYVETNSNEPKLGAFHTVGFAGLGVVAEVPEGKAFEAAHRVEYRALLVTLIVLCLAFMSGYFYADSITWPLQKLSVAARHISQGDFKIRLSPRSGDEVGSLTLTFNEMAEGLEERDRVKETFKKFHNREIAEKLLSGEVKLGGERKNAVIFFSDIRSFTALSESLTPEEIVELINEYMTSMVAVIRSHGGIVDKYVGDAIMALWGVPLQKEGDAASAIRACLGMRQELAKLNELRLSRRQPALKIGIGLNYGQVVAGNIGSDEKMEYTVIGDAVNTASRIESMTKTYGTDLLVSSSVIEQVKDEFIVEAAGSSQVKGKTNSILVYRILGYYGSQREKILIETPYSSYEPESSEKVTSQAA